MPRSPKAPFLQTLRQALTSGKPAVPGVPRIIPQPREQGFVKSFDGTRIYWELHGPKNHQGKTPMVFNYGLVCSMNQWRYQLSRYASERPCLLIDYRGHHRSEAPKDKRLLNLSAIAKDVAAAMRLFDFFDEGAHVWGHSMGVNVSLELAVAEPRLVKSLVLCCGTLDNPFHNMFGSDLLEKVTEPLFKSYGEHAETFQLVGRLILGQPKLTRIAAQVVGFNQDASTAQDMEAYALAVADVNPRIFFPLLIELSRGQTRAIAAQIKAPALVVAGAKDYVTPPAAQKALAASLKNSTYVEIPLGSHNVQLDFGEYVCLKAEEFWSGLSASP